MRKGIKYVTIGVFKIFTKLSKRGRQSTQKMDIRSGAVFWVSLKPL